MPTILADPEPYYADDSATLYLGRFEEVLPQLNVQADLIVTDPPYGETSLEWDRWPDGWPSLAATYARSMWCFGSMRMFLDRRHEFADWRLSQDVVWEKNTGTGMATDRFARVHEHALHWYRGDWSTVHHETPRIRIGNLHRVATKPPGAAKAAHLGGVTKTSAWEDDGTRLAHSVFRVHGMHRRGNHPTEKPTGVLEPLVEYGCPPGGLVLDIFAGGGSTLAAAKATGRRSVGIEAREEHCEAAAAKLSQGLLDFGEASA
jgi:site-specific DNA-methyltransferase (adenine-specific)